jgi:hypothetical protein
MSLAKKLTDAGADTLGARFTNICLDVLREKPDNIQQAWINVGDRFGYEFIVALKRDMEWHELSGMKRDGIEATALLEAGPAKLAAKWFEKNERIKILEMSNMPTDYEARKQAFIELELARAEAEKAHNEFNYWKLAE